MLIDLARFLFFLITLVLIALIESAVGLPLVTVAFFLIAVVSFSPVIGMIFLVFSSLIVAAIFTESWLLLFSLLGVGTVIFRSKLFRLRGVILPRLLLVLLIGIIIGGVHEPTITNSFMFHSLVSVVVSGVLLWRYIRSSGRQLATSTNWFGRQF